jgi:hypothetical protein
MPEPRIWWASTDEISWIPLDLSETGLTPDRWGSAEEGDSDFRLGVAGHTAFVIIDDRAGNREMWVLGLETPG